MVRGCLLAETQTRFCGAHTLGCSLCILISYACKRAYENNYKGWALWTGRFYLMKLRVQLTRTPRAQLTKRTLSRGGHGGGGRRLCARRAWPGAGGRGALRPAEGERR
jgi:hypothetical protein